jgi:hypothetical protein
MSNGINILRAVRGRHDHRRLPCPVVTVWRSARWLKTWGLLRSEQTPGAMGRVFIL